MTASSVWLFRIGLLVCWLLLNGLSIGQLLIGLLLALLIPLQQVKQTRRHSTAFRLFGFTRLLLSLLLDIVMSGWGVVRHVCSPRLHNRPQWLQLPLTLDNPHATAILASCISLTPGTISVEVDREGGVLLMHCLHVDDAAATLAQIHARYQRPLEELFA
jgi:multicomponent K+:H+ antiporter subunit E